MFQMALQFLADPTFFAGFSIVIGVAYVVVWVISLKEIAQPTPESYFRPIQRDPESDIREQRKLVQSSRRRNETVRVRRKTVKQKQGEAQRGRKVSRAA